MRNITKFPYLFVLFILFLLLYIKYDKSNADKIPRTQNEQKNVVKASGLTSLQREQLATEKAVFIEKSSLVCNNNFSKKLLNLLSDSYPDFRQFSLLAEEYITANAGRMSPDDVINIIDLIDSLGMEWILSDSILQVLVTHVSEFCIMDQRVVTKITEKFDSEITKTCIANGIFSNGNIRDSYKLDEYIEFSLRISQSYGFTNNAEGAFSRFVTAKEGHYLSSSEFATSFEKLLQKHDVSQFRTFIVKLDDRKFDSLIANKFMNKPMKDYFVKIRNSWINSFKERSGQ